MRKEEEGAREAEGSREKGCGHFLEREQLEDFCSLHKTTQQHERMLLWHCLCTVCMYWLVGPNAPCVVVHVNGSNHVGTAVIGGCQLATGVARKTACFLNFKTVFSKKL